MRVHYLAIVAGGVEHFPRHQGYLRADPERVQYWKDRLAQLGAGPKIGIGWRGGLPHTRFPVRSLSLSQFSPILAVPGVQAVSLQYTNCADEIAAFNAQTQNPVHHWPEAIADYAETAALVSALNVVISVCTAVVHLGGALGRPVWVMAPYVAEWRYGREGPDMIWYPSVRVFRQPKAGGWSPVVSAVRRALDKLGRAADNQVAPGGLAAPETA